MSGESYPCLPPKFIDCYPGLRVELSPQITLSPESNYEYNDTVVEVNDYMVVCLTREKKSDCFTDKTHSIGY